MTSTPDFSDLEAIDVPLRDLPDETAARLWLAVTRYDRPLQYRDRLGNWRSATGFDCAHLAHRLAPLPKTPDTVDWSHVHESVNFIARDENNRVDGYSTKPTQTSEMWVCFDGEVYTGLGKILASYKRGTCDWTDSLLIRPGHEGAGQ